MIIRLKCYCMQDETTLEVRDRRPDEDILDWMSLEVQVQITAWHSRRSPMCRSETLQYCKIPMNESSPGIGMAPKLDG